MESLCWCGRTGDAYSCLVLLTAQCSNPISLSLFQDCPIPRPCWLTKLLRFSGKWSLMACHGVSGQRLVKSTGSPTFLFHHCQLLVDLRQISNSSGHTWPLLLKAVPQSLSTIGSKFQFLASASLSCQLWIWEPFFLIKQISAPMTGKSW